MMYKVKGFKLRTVQEVSSEEQNRKLLASCRFIILQHLFEDTQEFVTHLIRAGATVDCVLGKEYSNDPSVVRALEEMGVRVMPIRYADIESSSLLDDLLTESLEQARANDQQVIVHEVGGYFHQAVLRVPDELQPYFLGVVEDTTFGYNRYKRVEDQLSVPVLQVARSPLKELEAVFVGEAIVLAFNNLMRTFGVSIPGREALVVGYGMIGTNVAKALKANNIQTTIYDTNHLRMIHAFMDGYRVVRSLDEELPKFDLVISATGTNAVEYGMIQNMKSGVILASGGSKNIEFDIRTLEETAFEIEALSEEVKKYTIEANGTEKDIVVLRDGTAINFREKSIPSEIIDIVYTEILHCMLSLIGERDRFETGLYELSPQEHSEISKKWLDNLHQPVAIHIRESTASTL